MSLIKVVGMNVDGSDLSFELPDAKVIFLRGRLKEHFLYVMESLLSMDASGYYGELDCHEQADLSGGAFMLFSGGGAVKSKDKFVEATGLIPPTHVIRYTGKGQTFRSFYMERGLSTYSPVYTDMRRYSHAIDDAKWIRLIGVVNNLLGFEFVRLIDGRLDFHPKAGLPISQEGQKFVYMLMAECYLTPDKYKRVLLLSDIPYLDRQDELRLIQRLSYINGHLLALSTAGVDFSDIKPGSSISFLSV